MRCVVCQVIPLGTHSLDMWLGSGASVILGNMGATTLPYAAGANRIDVLEREKETGIL